MLWPVQVPWGVGHVERGQKQPGSGLLLQASSFGTAPFL